MSQIEQLLNKTFKDKMDFFLGKNTTSMDKDDLLRGITNADNEIIDQLPDDQARSSSNSNDGDFPPSDEAVSLETSSSVTRGRDPGRNT